MATATTEETSMSEDESNDPPTVHIDYRVFEISVEGGEGNTLEEVNEIMDSRIENALEDIEELKRTDFNLDEEFEVDRDTSAGYVQ